jgi:hypothetical protein
VRIRSAIPFDPERNGEVPDEHARLRLWPKMSADSPRFPLFMNNACEPIMASVKMHEGRPSLRELGP